MGPLAEAVFHLPKEQMKEKLLAGGAVDAAAVAQDDTLLQSIKNLDLHSMTVTEPTPDVIYAIAELNLEHLKLRYHEDGGAGFSDRGQCFVKLLQGEKLVSLDFEFSKDSSELEGVNEGLDKCHLSELTIGNPRDEKSLSDALIHVRSLENLEVRNWSDEAAVEHLITGLAAPGCTIRKFYFRGRFPCHRQITRILPESKLTSLGMMIFQPHRILLKDALDFTNALETSRLKHLTLVVEASRGGQCFFLNELARARQSSDQQLSSLQLILLNSEISDVSGFLKSNVESLKLSSFATKVEPSLSRQLVQALSSPLFRLKHLSIDETPSQEESQEIVAYLNENYECPLESLELGTSSKWNSTPFGKQAEKILGNNKIYRAGFASMARPHAGFAHPKSFASAEELVEASVAKLFICGDDGAGKSTVARNLFKTYSKPILSRNTKPHLGRLAFGKRHLLVCDFNRRTELDALHHYIAKGSDKDLFLIVCRAPIAEGHRDFEDRLRYWFRFVLSHRSLSSRKPKMMVVLNHFPDSEKVKTGITTLNRDAQTKCSSVIQEYKSQLDFGNARENIVGLRAIYRRQVQALKKQLQVNLDELLKSRPKIPKPCRSIMEIAAASKRQVVSLDGLLQLCPEDDMNKDRLNAGLTFLHNQGEVLYFEHYESIDEERRRFVILDVWWFAQKIIRVFLQHDRLMPIAEIRSKVGMRCQEPYVQYVIFALHQLGLLLLDNISAPREGRVLACSKGKDGTGTYNWDSTSDPSRYHYQGRRFECRGDNTLIPLGAFMLFQIKVAGMFSPCHPKGGSLYVVKDSVHAIIRLSGPQLQDRQWVDIMLRLPESSSLEDADVLLQELRNCLLGVCGAEGSVPIDLEEKVIRPASVEGQICDETVSLGKLLQEADQHFDSEGLLYRHIWEHKDSNTICELISPSERRLYEDEKLKMLEAINYQVEDCVSEKVADTPILDGILTSETRKDADSVLELELSKAVEQITTTMQAIGADIKNRIAESERNIIDEVRHLRVQVSKEMQALRSQGDKILSKLRLQFDFNLPKYPYLTDNDNVLERYAHVLLPGKSVRLHFLCEYGQCHPVNDQKGVHISVRPDWLSKLAPVLIPALRILYFGAQIASTMFLGVKLPLKLSAIDYKSGGIQTMVSNFLGENSAHLYKASPAPDELRGFYEDYLRTVIGDQYRDMEKYFNLYKMERDNKVIWVCRKHR